ncbi:hypothetical protein C8J56DRAFT_895033 [Mycena floridula]|nr:hypothetical protein C8J56DRAFT_895033 [Mycena floridula]
MSGEITHFPGMSDGITQVMSVVAGLLYQDGSGMIIAGRPRQIFRGSKMMKGKLLFFTTGGILHFWDDKGRFLGLWESLSCIKFNIFMARKLSNFSLFLNRRKSGADGYPGSHCIDPKEVIELGCEGYSGSEPTSWAPAKMLAVGNFTGLPREQLRITVPIKRQFIRNHSK